MKGISFKLFWSFLKIGAFTFGGGYAMIPLIEDEVVNKNSWIEKDRFLELLTLAQSAPGPISLNTAVFVGYSMNRYKGAIASVLGVVIPSFFIILLVAMYFRDVQDNRVVEAMFKGMRPAVVALIAAPVFGLAKGMNAYRIGIAILAAAAVWRLAVSPIWFIVIGAVGGVLWVLWRRRNGDGKESEDTDNGVDSVKSVNNVRSTEEEKREGER